MATTQRRTGVTDGPAATAPLASVFEGGWLAPGVEVDVDPSTAARTPDEGFETITMVNAIQMSKAKYRIVTGATLGIATAERAPPPRRGPDAFLGRS